MAEILTCPKCERKLQVPEQFLGQTVQCPECRHQFVAKQSAVSATPIPAASASAGSAEASQAGSRRYDDEDDDDLDVRRRRRDEDDFDDEFSPRHRRVGRDYVPHRGGLVMALGLVALVGGFAFCVPVVLGPVAWILGTIDLREIREGRMDPAGDGMTRSGQICGIISTLFLLLGMAFVVFMFFAN